SGRTGSWRATGPLSRARPRPGPHSGTIARGPGVPVTSGPSSRRRGGHMARGTVVQKQVASPAKRAPKKPGLVYPGLTVPFILLITCFAAWGAAANLTDVLVGVFRHIFTMSN